MSEILLAIAPIPRREHGNFFTPTRNFLDGSADLPGNKYYLAAFFHMEDIQDDLDAMKGRTDASMAASLG